MILGLLSFKVKLLMRKAAFLRFSPNLMLKYANFFCLLHFLIVPFQLRVVCSLINYEDNELLSFLYHKFEMMISDKSSVSRALSLVLFDALKV